MSKPGITIEDLQNYRFWKREISVIDDKIAAIYSHLPTTGRESTGARSTSPGDPTAYKAHKIDAMRQRKTRLIESITRVEFWLDHCESAEIALICRCHYISGMSWRETAHAVYNDQTDESRARKRIARYFES